MKSRTIMFFSFLFILFILFPPSWSLALPSVGTEDKTSTSIQGDSSISRSKQFQQELSKIKKEAQIFRKNMDRSTSNNVRKSSEKMQSRSVDIDLPLQANFLNILARWEDEGREPFVHYKVVTNPKLIRDFFYGYKKNGKMSETRGLRLNAVMLSKMQKYAQGNAPLNLLDLINESGIKTYLNNVAYYGCLIGQAFLYLKEDIDLLDVQAKENRKTISANISYDDFSILAEAALEKAASGLFGLNFNSKMIVNLHYSINKDDSPCYFGGDINVVKCGRSVIKLSTPPELNVSNIVVYGDSFAGFSGAFRVSSGLSWGNAIENLKNTTEGQEFTKEVTRSKDRLLSQGMTREAVFLTKAAWESVSGSSSSISAGSLSGQ